MLCLMRWSLLLLGKFVSELEPEEYARRSVRGLHVSQLYHPKNPLSYYAERFLECHDEADLQVFWNTTLGLPYTVSTEPVTEDMLEKLQCEVLINALPDEVEFVTAG